MEEDKVTISVDQGPRIHGCDDYTVAWSDMLTVVEDWLDDIKAGERRSLSFKLVRKPTE